MCGIFGIINPKPTKFDYQTYCVMGNVNDSRGGDSCGMFIDGETDYGIEGHDKFFSNYFLKSDLLKKTQKCTIALGHCRKTSPGMKTGREQAQPIVLRGKDSHEVKMVVIHNGTIYNYEALAKKYIPDTDITGMSDTQVMARIFYHTGYDVLEEYTGGAVFVIVDYRNKDENGYPQVLFWKGSSRKSEYPINAQPEDERPLEFVVHKGSLYFSSIGNLFPALLRGEEVFYTMYDNTLCQYVPGSEDLKLLKKYDRSKKCQSKTYNNSSYGGTNTVYGGGYSKGTSSNSSNTSKKSNAGEETMIYDGLLFQTSNQNTYKRKGKPVHGKAIVDYTGRFQKEIGTTSQVVWFYYGVALDLERGHQYWKFLEYLRKKSGLELEEFAKKFEVAIRYLSFDKLFFREGILMKATGAQECEIYTGPFHMIGNSSGENYKEGQRDFGNIYTSTDYKIPFNRYNEQEKQSVELQDFREKCILLMN